MVPGGGSNEDGIFHSEGIRESCSLFLSAAISCQNLTVMVDSYRDRKDNLIMLQLHELESECRRFKYAIVTCRHVYQHDTITHHGTEMRAANSNAIRRMSDGDVGMELLKKRGISYR